MDTLMREAEGAGGPTREPSRKDRRRRERREQSPLEMQKGVIRLSFTVIVFITIIGYAGRTMAREYPASDIWNNEYVSIVGFFAFAAAVFLLMRASRVGRLTREPMSPAEASRLQYVSLGCFLLWLVPFVGSFGYYFGIVFQTSNMHWLFYVFVGGGMLSILYGLSGSKEKSSFYKIFMFGVYGILMATIP
ncbi:MAG: hypothetical protein KAS77_13330, partial [Thermoplasmata archaeon]|nr:hypothetical protein [Thermoplasmata archaeon]